MEVVSPKIYIKKRNSCALLQPHQSEGHSINATDGPPVHIALPLPEPRIKLFFLLSPTQKCMLLIASCNVLEMIDYCTKKYSFCNIVALLLYSTTAM